LDIAIVICLVGGKLFRQHLREELLDFCSHVSLSLSTAG